MTGSIRLKTVYRVEHSVTGEGPYSLQASLVDKLLREMQQKHSSDVVQHPTILHDTPVKGYVMEGLFKCLSDGLLDVGMSFGFRSLPQLREWFTDDDLRILHANGFNLVRYQVRRQYTFGYSKQTLFFKNQAEIEFAQNLISLVRV